MSIIQISKIQQRSGNIVDLPQLDEAEFGWASDTKQLFIGKTTPNENIEVLTSYSQINFDQINGSVGNLNISNISVADGQVLAYDGNNWVNRGGNAGGLINLGEVSNVKISGGAIGYVLETDGLGNLSWTPKSTIISFIQNVSKANPAIVTTTQDNFFTDGTRITITGAQGMTQLNGNTYYANVLTANTFSLYANSDLSGPINSTGFSTYAFTSAASTTASTNVITIGDSSLFSLNQEVEFVGNLGNSTLENNVPYYIKTKPSGTSITVSETLLANGTAGDVKPLVTATLTGANVYATGGRAIATVSGGGGSSAAAGVAGSIQFYGGGILAADADLNWNSVSSPKTLTATGNINTGNVSATGVITAPQLTSNIATGTAPLTVTSTTRVANLNVDRANVSDFGTVTNQTTGTFFPVLVNSSATGNRALGANANISFNAATGALTSTLFTGTLTTAAQPNVTSLGTLTSLGVNGTITGVNITANTGVFTGNASGLSEINASNLSSGTVPTARLSGSYPITVSNAAQPNITSVGTLTTLAVSGTTGVVSTDSSAAASITKIIRAVNGTQDIALIPRAGAGSYNTLTAADDALITFANSSAQGNANLTIAPWASANTGIRIQSVSNTATIFLNASTTNVSAALNVAGTITAPAFTANTGVFTGNGSGLTNLNGSNVTGTVASATSAGSATTAGTVTTAAQGNITSVGTLTGLTTSGNTYLGTASTSNVGIGTISPATKLHVYSDDGNTPVTLTQNFAGANAAFTALGITQGASFGVRDTGTYVTSTSDTIFYYNTSETVRIQATGNVGIGNAAPTHKLSVNGTAAISTSLQVANITTGANTTAGSITGNWTLTAGSRMQATYADLAEYYEADESYEPGTVLMFGGEKEVTLADDGTSRVAGVVSTNPAYVMNSTCPGLLTAVALQGRVPCKVRGKISKGDMLISGGNGFARPNQFPSMGTVIGKALENFDGYEGVIEVAVGRL